MDYKLLAKNIVRNYFEAEWRKGLAGLKPTPLDLQHFDHAFEPNGGFVRIIDNSAGLAARDIGSCAKFTPTSQKLAAREHKVATPIAPIHPEADVLLAVTMLLDDLRMRLQDIRREADIHFEITPPVLAWHEAPSGNIGMSVFCSVFGLGTWKPVEAPAPVC